MKKEMEESLFILKLSTPEFLRQFFSEFPMLRVDYKIRLDNTYYTNLEKVSKRYSKKQRKHIVGVMKTQINNINTSSNKVLTTAAVLTTCVTGILAILIALNQTISIWTLYFFGTLIMILLTILADDLLNRRIRKKMTRIIEIFEYIDKFYK